MKRRRVGSLLALAVLAVVQERPVHPYEMASVLRARGKDQDMPIKWGSLYTVVGNLEKHGLIEVAGSERSGARPERTVYRITDAGRDELADWVRELLGTPEREQPSGQAVRARRHRRRGRPPCAGQAAALRSQVDGQPGRRWPNGVAQLFLVEASDLAIHHELTSPAACCRPADQAGCGSSTMRPGCGGPASSREEAEGGNRGDGVAASSAPRGDGYRSFRRRGRRYWWAGALADQFTVVLRTAAAAAPASRSAPTGRWTRVEDVAAVIAAPPGSRSGELGRDPLLEAALTGAFDPGSRLSRRVVGGSVGPAGPRDRRPARPRRRAGGAGDRHARGPDGTGVHPEAAAAAAGADDRGHDGPHRRRPAELPRARLDPALRRADRGRAGRVRRPVRGGHRADAAARW